MAVVPRARATAADMDRRAVAHCEPFRSWGNNNAGVVALVDKALVEVRIATCAPRSKTREATDPSSMILCLLFTQIHLSFHERDENRDIVMFFL